MRKKKTHEEFIQQLSTINASIQILSEYVGSLDKIRCRCNKCNTEWDTTPNSLLSTKSGCPKCARANIYNTTRKTESVFLEEVQTKNPSVEILEHYVSDKQHIKVKCKKCGHLWESMPCHLIRGHACPECAKQKRVEAMRLARKLRQK